MPRNIPEGALARTMVRIALAHVTAGDDRLLRERVGTRAESGRTGVHEWREVAYDAFYALPMEGGWLLRVQEDGAGDEDRRARDAGFSRAFVGLLAFWRERDVDWVRLDRDADRLASLPAFEW